MTLTPCTIGFHLQVSESYSSLPAADYIFTDDLWHDMCSGIRISFAELKMHAHDTR
jgi:hypothetical protein